MTNAGPGIRDSIITNCNVSDFKKLTLWRTGEWNGELVFNRDRVSVWEDEKIREMDGGDGCTL